MNDELKRQLSMSFEMLMLNVVAQEGWPIPSQELHDQLKLIYLKGAEDVLGLIKKGGRNEDEKDSD